MDTSLLASCRYSGSYGNSPGNTQQRAEVQELNNNLGLAGGLLSLFEQMTARDTQKVIKTQTHAQPQIGLVPGTCGSEGERTG